MGGVVCLLTEADHVGPHNRECPRYARPTLPTPDAAGSAGVVRTSLFTEHVTDRDGLVWRVVRDGGMATRAHYAGIVSIGIATLERESGPLVTLAANVASASAADRERVAREMEAKIRPLLEVDKYEGGYDCCGCGTYDEILDHAIRIVRAEPTP